MMKLKNASKIINVAKMRMLIVVMEWIYEMR